MVDPVGGMEALLHAFTELVRTILEIVRLIRLLAGG